jgi:hypothetical protein
MSSRKKLEKVLEYCLNDREKEASALLHEWFVEVARKINTKLMEDEELSNDDEMNKDLDELDTLEGKTDTEDGEENKEVDGDLDFSNVKDEIEELRNEIDNLKADLEELMKDEEDEEDEEGEEDEEDVEGEEYDDENTEEKDEEDDVLEDEEEEDDEDDMENWDWEDLEDEEDIEDHEDDKKDVLTDDEMDMEDDEELKKLLSDEEDKEEDLDNVEDDEMVEEDDEEDFDNIVEDAMSVLKTVKSNNTEDEVGSGGNKKFEPNKKSPLPQKKAKDRMDGATPLNRKDVNYKGKYDLEDPPSYKTVKSYSNTHNSTKNVLHAVPREGDSSALLNKKDNKGNVYSPLSLKGKREK